MIKEIVKNLNLSSTLRINEISKDLEAQGKDVFKFGFGQSPFKVPDDVVLELKNNANKNNYLPVQGLPELREAIAVDEKSKQNGGWNCKLNDVYICHGVTEALQIIFATFLILSVEPTDVPPNFITNIFIDSYQNNIN